jgi:hypothetical protein
MKRHSADEVWLAHMPPAANMRAESSFHSRICQSAIGRNAVALCLVFAYSIFWVLQPALHCLRAGLQTDPLGVPVGFRERQITAISFQNVVAIIVLSAVAGVETGIEVSRTIIGCWGRYWRSPQRHKISDAANLSPGNASFGDRKFSLWKIPLHVCERRVAWGIRACVAYRKRAVGGRWAEQASPFHSTCGSLMMRKSF